MSKGINPVLLIQLLLQYNEPQKEGVARNFVFNKNHRMRVHKETADEVSRRKSVLNPATMDKTRNYLYELLREQLKDRIGKVWIDPAFKKIAVPINMTASQDGYGTLPIGSRVDIPEGKFIRAFTYWEKVDDIDLSCFAIDRNGRKEEFSWRNMYAKQSEAIAFSGDQTRGFEGGSEYLDINIEAFKREYPQYKYIVFCNNVYTSSGAFNKCFCKAGFMIREEDPKKIPIWKGERINGDLLQEENR